MRRSFGEKMISSEDSFVEEVVEVKCCSEFSRWQLPKWVMQDREGMGSSMGSDGQLNQYKVGSCQALPQSDQFKQVKEKARKSDTEEAWRTTNPAQKGNVEISKSNTIVADGDVLKGGENKGKAVGTEQVEGCIENLCDVDLVVKHLLHPRVCRTAHSQDAVFHASFGKSHAEELQGEDAQFRAEGFLLSQAEENKPKEEQDLFVKEVAEKKCSSESSQRQQPRWIMWDREGISSSMRDGIRTGSMCKNTSLHLDGLRTVSGRLDQAMMGN
ncbi:hypothetical protein JD844_013821 [Phrynosoma platyrhinos]|uniref:Uncharacterized protein n=1 Tax=Phrynosoma platyrhinos TaxID=52577 RepID=A0ABQ7TLQ0_PHRPL|nr:hypothetical protein JD844_013821 [Phrynosoma platyrhinos]